MGVRTRYEKELKNVVDNLVLMCRHIEIAIENCVKSLADRDFALARKVYAEDKLIDQMERDIEQACLRILLMEHPVANDFHEISAALKMITDLERIGDQARDIAEIAMQLGDAECLRVKDEKISFTPLDLKTGKTGGGESREIEHLTQMAVIVIQMVNLSIKAYINRDLELARSLDRTDDKVDDLFNLVMSDLTALIKQNPANTEQGIRFMMITKYLERIGDHAVNIGEWVEYAITGNHPKKVKHTSDYM